MNDQTYNRVLVYIRLIMHAYVYKLLEYRFVTIYNLYMNVPRFSR